MLKRIKLNSLDNLSSKSSEEEGNRDGTSGGGELSSASPGDFSFDSAIWLLVCS